MIKKVIINNEGDRIMADIIAYVKDKTTVVVELSNSFYNGESNYFRLRSNDGFSQKLPILSTEVLEHVTRYTLQNDYFKVGKSFIISDCHNMSCNLEIGFYVRSKEFNDEYYYDGDDLGATYTKDFTTFKVWSPIANEVFVKLDKVYKMEILDCGVWYAKVEGDLDGMAYTYLVNINGSWREAVDPYAYSSLPNGTKSVVINPRKCNVDLKKEGLPAFLHNVDASIYELHVRDFSSSDSASFVNRGKFLAFLENPETKNGTRVGLDYIKSLGITHVQLLPIYDFGSVDELNQFDYYNWGYDPMQYSIPEGSYASNVLDPYSRIIDCKKMVASIHEHGMRVVMDVVYNHMFGISITAFDKLMPLYYFRYGENGEISNGSFCGNDFDSLMPMARKYILDSTKRWVEFYGIDGFRFDLMGIIDYQTMNLIYEQSRQLDESFIIYGEGWNMPSLLDSELKAAQYNNAKMPHIGHFNDRFRDTIKGATQHEDIKKKGYATGDISYCEVATDVVIGTSLPVAYDYCYLNPNQVVNYTECHDNNTVYDKLVKSNSDETDAQIKKRAKLILAMIYLSQGIPFIHAGQEFLRTKGGDHNSYISSDEVNKLDYDLMEKNIDVVNYVRALNRFRKENSCFRLNTREEILNTIDITYDDLGVIKYSCGDYVVYFNPTKEDITLDEKAVVIDIVKNEERTASKLVLENISATIVKK